MNNTLRNLSTVAVIALLVMLGASCDLGGSSSSSGASLGAGDALRAIPLPSEAVLGSGSSAALNAAGLRALEASWPDFDQDAWEDACDEEEGSTYDDEVCEVFNTWHGDFLSSDIFMGILRDLGTQTAIPLQLEVQNRLERLPKTAFPNYPYAEALKDEVDGGVLLVRTTSNGAVIRWVVDINGWFPENGEEDSDDYESDGRFYFEVVLTGWPGNVNQAEFWMIEEYSIDEGDTQDPRRLEYQRINLDERAADKYVIQPEKNTENRSKREIMVFRGTTGGGLDAVASFDSYDNERGIISYMLRDNYTGTAKMQFDQTRVEFLIDSPEENPTNTDVKVFDNDNDFSVLIREAAADAGSTNRTIHDRDLNLNREVGDDASDQHESWLAALLDRSAELYETWKTFSMPISEPDIDTFPTLD